MKKKALLVTVFFYIFTFQGFAEENNNNMIKVKIETENEFSKSSILKINKNFYISKYEVTQGEFEKIMGYNPSYFKSSKTNSYPVEQVTWYDAVVYCNEKSKAEGVNEYYNITDIKKIEDNIVDATVSINESSTGYRLPTKKEWIYAAGGGEFGKGYVYSGSEVLKECGWYEENAEEGEKYSLTAVVRGTQSVGRKKPNELGIYDMSGNVWEWCWDDFGRYEGYKVLLGGAYSSHDYNCEITYSNGFSSYNSSLLNGFRVCRDE